LLNKPYQKTLDPKPSLNKLPFSQLTFKNLFKT
jgi:hypothetical protein